MTYSASFTFPLSYHIQHILAFIYFVQDKVMHAEIHTRANSHYRTLSSAATASLAWSCFENANSPSRLLPRRLLCSELLSDHHSHGGQ